MESLETWLSIYVENLAFFAVKCSEVEVDIRDILICKVSKRALKYNPI
jgi:hypothetical protein